MERDRTYLAVSIDDAFYLILLNYNWFNSINNNCYRHRYSLIGDVTAGCLQNESVANLPSKTWDIYEGESPQSVNIFSQFQQVSS